MKKYLYFLLLFPKLVFAIPPTYYEDLDGDGFGNPLVFRTDYQPSNYVTNKLDCNDTNSLINPNTIWYLDGDSDGFGGTTTTFTGCVAPNASYVLTNTDCNDANPAINPQTIWYLDYDGDGYGTNADTPTSQMASCTQPVGYVSNNLDCNDIKALQIFNTWYKDNDGDGFGTSTISVVVCTQPLGYVSNSTDCNDSDPAINPNTNWYVDANGDGLLSDTEQLVVYTQCTAPANSISPTAEKNFHWIHNVSYDINGAITGSSRTYYDDLGKPNLTLTKDFVGNKIWGTEQTYDDFGRAEKSSFVAPSPFNSFRKIGFLTTQYNYESTSSLANYYSDNNTDELYQATATQPYSQTNYDKLNPGNVINVVGGNKINNEWKTGYSYTVPAAQEMYYVYGYSYYDGLFSNASLPNAEEIITKFYKSVSVDANGVENVSFTDGEGKVLATARSGGAAMYPVLSLISTKGYVDIHIPAGVTTAATIFGFATTSEYKVFTLKDGLEIIPTPSTLASGNAYRIAAITPPTTDPKVYVTNVATGGALSSESGAKGIAYNVNYYDYSVNIYNKTGQLVKTIQPNGYQANTVIKDVPAHMTSSNFASTYLYNTLGQLIQASSPDEGTSKFAYRKDGQIRYSQSTLQSDTKVSYTDYDTYGRPIESGVITTATGIWALAIANPDAVLIGTLAQRSEQTFTVYDYPTNNQTAVPLPTTPLDLTLSGVLTTAGIPTTNYTQNNLSGNVAITYTKPASSITAITWYSYDIYGRTQWMVQYNEGLGAKTIHYMYDYKGNVQQVIYQKDKTTELFVHRYTYDANDVLKKVETSANGTSFITHADYTYYKTGELKRVNIAQGAQGLDYVYTLGGQLKSINHPSLEAAKDPGGDTNDVFGITLDYYNGDYLRTGRNITSSPTAGADYNGNIKAARWANKSTSMDFIGSIVNQKGYLYNYDRNNWLTEATFGNTSATTGAITTATSYKEGSLTYDPNGNIKTLQRTNQAGTTVDNLTYNYTNTGKNQLNSISESAAVTTDATDIETQGSGNYVYDVLGQLTRNIQENLYYYYNTQGLVTQVNKGVNPVVKFYYNERGQRIKKESFNTASPYLLIYTDYYLLDLSGNVMSIYNKPVASAIVQKEMPIFGLTRLGVYNKSDGSSSYQITDHLGNVRAVLNKSAIGAVTMNSYADYYPFGEQLPARNSNSGNYRYAFQGQELDGETGMEAFQLRLWDGRIGRWLSPDPYGQYASPYLGMGNNPVSMIDPDGGAAGDPTKVVYPTNPSNGATFTSPDGGKWEYTNGNWQGQGFIPENLQEVVIVVQSRAKAQAAAINITGAVPVSYFLESLLAEISSSFSAGAVTISAEIFWPVTTVVAAGGFAYFASNLGTPYKPTFAEATASGCISCTSGSAAYRDNYYPGPWKYTYEPPSQNPIHNSSPWDPKKPNWNDKGSLVRAIGVGVVSYQVYKKMRESSGKDLESYIKELAKIKEQPQFKQAK